MIEIEVNGEARRVAAQTTLSDLLAQLEVPDQALALAVNRTVVPRQQWRAHLLAARDQVEIVRAIGGG